MTLAENSTMNTPNSEYGGRLVAFIKRLAISTLSTQSGIGHLMLILPDNREIGCQNTTLILLEAFRLYNRWKRVLKFRYISISKHIANKAEVICRFSERIHKHIEDNYIDFMPNHTTSDMYVCISCFNKIWTSISRLNRYIEDGEHLLRDTEHLLSNVSSDTHFDWARYNPLKIWDFLLENCLMPMVVKVSVELLNDNEEYSQLNISYFLKRLLLDCLTNINVNVLAELVFSIIGGQIKDRLLKLIVDKCLMDSVPATMDEYHKSTLVRDVLRFEQTLVDNFFIHPLSLAYSEPSSICVGGRRRCFNRK
uniref:Centromere/kinetochore protein zw10 middle domain-containing protein n=1 Tax=Glossina palpalis gambiensis TaxID=67801 RepID=A0A1B0BZH8_9MUSC